MNLKKLNLTVLLVTILVLVPTIQIVYASPLSTFYLSGGIYPQAHYTVWKEGSYYYAKDIYGFIPSWGKSTNGSYVLQTALDSLSSGRTWKETVKVLELFYLKTTLRIPSYTRLWIEGTLKLEAGSNCQMLRNSDWTLGNSYIELCGGGIIDYNGANQNDGASRENRTIIDFEKVHHSSIHDLTIQNGRTGAGIILGGTGGGAVNYDNVLDNLQFYDMGVVGASFSCDAIWTNGHRLLISNIKAVWVTDTGIACDNVGWVTISDVNIHQAYTHGIALGQGAHHVTLSGININGNKEFSGQKGISIEPHGGASPYCIEASEINIYGMCRFGIVLTSTNDTVINGGLINFCGNTTDGHGIALNGTVRTLVSDFLVNDCDGWGLYEWGGGNMSQISTSNFWNNAEGGIHLEQTNSTCHLTWNATEWES